MGPEATVTALNLTLGLASACVAWRYWLWLWRERVALAPLALRELPVAVAILTSGLAVERCFYAAARILRHYRGADLWTWHGVIVTIGMVLLIASAWHLRPIWRAQQRRENRLSGIMLISILVVWGSLTVVLY